MKEIKFTECGYVMYFNTTVFLVLQGDYVWVDSGVGVPIGAEVKLTDTGQLSLIDDEGKVKHKIECCAKVLGHQMF